MSNIIESIGVHIKVNSIEESRKFYEEVLGLKPKFAYGTDAFRATLPIGVFSVADEYNGVEYDVGLGARFEIADGHIAVKNTSFFKQKLSHLRFLQCLMFHRWYPY